MVTLGFAVCAAAGSAASAAIALMLSSLIDSLMRSSRFFLLFVMTAFCRLMLKLQFLRPWPHPSMLTIRARERRETQVRECRPATGVRQIDLDFFENRRRSAFSPPPRSPISTASRSSG